MSTIAITNNTDALLNTINTFNVGTYIENLTVRERVNLGLAAISDLNKYTTIDYQAGGYLNYGLTSATTYKVDLDDWSITYSGLKYTSSGGSIINKIAAYQYSTDEYITIEGNIQYAGAPFFSGLIDGATFSSIRISSSGKGVGLGLDAQWAGEYIVGTIKSLDSSVFSKEYQAGATSIFYSEYLQGDIGFRLAGSGADSLNSAITSGTFNYVHIGLYDNLSSTFTDTYEMVDALYDLNKTANEAVNFSGDDTVYLKGRYGSEYSTLDGKDIIYSSPGNDIIDGGSGSDTAVYSGIRSGYAVTKTSSGVTVKDNAGLDGVDMLNNIERLQFSDKIVALDIDGIAGKAYRIYQAAFARTPDNDGLKYWINTMDTGHSLEAVAGGFIASEEFKSLYGNAPSNEMFVTKLYNNVLRRAPEKGGFDYWVGLLDDRKISQVSTLINFSESGENQLNVIGVIENGIELFS